MLYPKQLILALVIICAAIVLSLFLVLGTTQQQQVSGQSFNSTLATELFTNAYSDKDPVGEGKVVEYPLEAAQTVIQLPTGEVSNSWNYNGTVPGPEIRIVLGDTLRIPFTNNLPDETTIHFHGIRVPNAMDGVPGVTQPPVQPGESFVYEFTPKDAGTYWFHPHVRGSEQVERGLYGVIVVEDEYSRSLDHDKVLVIDDWRIDGDGNIAEPFNHPHDVSHGGRWGNLVTVNATSTEEITVAPGETIRLRLVNTSNARSYRIGANQDVQVVAFDGMYVADPYVLEKELLAPGNRIDIEWTAQVGTELVLEDDFEQTVRTLARVSVEGVQRETPVAAVYPEVHMPEWLREDFVESAPDQIYTLDGLGGHMMSLDWGINEDRYGEDTPTQYQLDQAYKIQLKNTSVQLHPMHFHGQFFMVVARDGEMLTQARWQDTVLVLPEETVDIVMMPRDKGEWAMHCHILEHADAGMMTTFTVD